MTRSERILCIAFLLAITLPLGGMLLQGHRTSTAEQRTLAPRPTFTLAGRHSFPRQFERYFEDHFGFRSELIQLHHLVALRLLHVSPVSNVVLGRDQWLYYRGLRDGASIEDLQGRLPFSDEDLDRLRGAVQATHDRLAARGIRYLLVLVPNKQTIYPEHLPDELQPRGARTRLDQLTAHLAAHATVPVLDLRDTLHRAKGADDLYLHSDSHWNNLGAFLGYQALARALAAQGIAIKPRTPADFIIEPTPFTDGDLARMLGLGRAWGDREFAIRPRGGHQAHQIPSADRFRDQAPTAVTENPSPGLPRAVVLHDSFGVRWIQFLGEDFARCYFFQFSSANGFDPALIERERPDVVIEEVTERYLGRLTELEWKP
ncbi:MAG TPA: hypothetical protein VH877_13185 [Polyangia bacterium]|jgi:hypothetical protein|nr:hypothetical protein [Polyangia bacterium]